MAKRLFIFSEDEIRTLIEGLEEYTSSIKVNPDFEVLDRFELIEESDKLKAYLEKGLE